ncbi:YciI family protein [Occultella kanbiaonis]|uniref:YciI family protein n=1 Tax=Occultella kanbiaonis TaxID=2675754 RepID=UPI0013D46CEA|nr:YciI family protein [Occultella kanbiaonis]
MRFLCMVKMDEHSPNEVPASLYEAMAAYEREGRTNGTLVESQGLLPSDAGALVSAVDGRVKSVDGPFAEAKELVGGYAIVDVHSRAEAVELGRRLVRLHLEHIPAWDGVVEIRQIAEV